MKNFLTVLVIASLAISIPSCKAKVKDADLKTSVDAVLSANPDYRGTSADVKDGVATLSGEVKDASVQSGLKTDVAAVKGIKSVQNNTTIAAPVVIDAPVITADDKLTSDLKDAIKDNPGVTATVKDGIVTLTGSIKKSDLQKLMQKVNNLQPRKVENNLTIN